MYDQTVYPAKSNKKLIPSKNNRPTNIYGGFSGNKDAYLAIVKILGKKGDTYKVVGVPRRFSDELLNAYNDDYSEYLNKLHDVLVTQFTKKQRNKKTGKIIKKIENFEIVVGKVNYRQRIIDRNQSFMLGSSTYKYNTKQLVLTESSMKILSNFKHASDDNLNLVYDEILEKVNESFELYDKNGFRKKLNNNIDKFRKLPCKSIFEKNKLISVGKCEILFQILNGLHANATMGDLKGIGFSTPFGFMQDASGIKLNKDSMLLYQSPTGLFERKVKLSDL
nr:Cas9 endonuclease PAM-interacting domain-containing protein [Pediococcus pentosaceus]